MIVPFIFLNVFIGTYPRISSQMLPSFLCAIVSNLTFCSECADIVGVLLENFSIFYNDDDTRLNRSTIKDFKHKWRLFNSDSDVSIVSFRAGTVCVPEQ